MNVWIPTILVQVLLVLAHQYWYQYCFQKATNTVCAQCPSLYGFYEQSMDYQYEILRA